MKTSRKAGIIRNVVTYAILTGVVSAQTDRVPSTQAEGPIRAREATYQELLRSIKPRPSRDQQPAQLAARLLHRTNDGYIRFLLMPRSSHIEVAKWDVNDYTPVADPCDSGALGGLGTNGITIEMGALYYPTEDSSPNAPPNSGQLFTLTVSEPATVTIALNEIRGGIVLTDPEKPATVTLNQAMAVVSGGSGVVPAGRPDYAEWVAVGKPPCWAYPRQCHGDADGQAVTASTGTYYVGTADLNVLINAWQVREAPFGPGIASIENGICADFGHDREGNNETGWYRVGTRDLNILIGSWLVKEPPAGPGVPADCAGRVQ